MGTTPQGGGTAGPTVAWQTPQTKPYIKGPIARSPCSGKMIGTRNLILLTVELAALPTKFEGRWQERGHEVWDIVVRKRG